MKTLIGIGVLNWPKHERISDRYGTITLTRNEGEQVELESLPIGQEGTLSLVVVEPRMSSHIGDIFRGFRQMEIPRLGQEAELGTGKFFVDSVIGHLRPFGVRPAGRRFDWLNPQVLYAFHESIVRIWWEDKV